MKTRWQLLPEVLGPEGGCCFYGSSEEVADKLSDLFSALRTPYHSLGPSRSEVRCLSQANGFLYFLGVFFSPLNIKEIICTITFQSHKFMSCISVIGGVCVKKIASRRLLRCIKSAPATPESIKLNIQQPKEAIFNLCMGTYMGDP